MSNYKLIKDVALVVVPLIKDFIKDKTKVNANESLKTDINYLSKKNLTLELQIKDLETKLKNTNENHKSLSHTFWFFNTIYIITLVILLVKLFYK